MAVDASTPVPDELDARVDQMLQHMDRVHADVLSRLEPAADGEAGAPDAMSQLDADVARALKEAVDAANAVKGPPSSAAQSVPVETPASVEVPTAVETPVTVEAPVVVEQPAAVELPVAVEQPVVAETPVPPIDEAPEPVHEASDEVASPAGTIKELDEQLASAVSETIDDEFADGSQLVEGQSLEVPLPNSGPNAAPPAADAPAAPSPAAAPAAPAVPAAVPAEASGPVAAAPAPVPVSAPVVAAAAASAPAPAAAVAAPAPVAKPAPAPAAKPVAAPVKPAAAVVAAPKPAGPTLADHFWKIATPVMEPIAVRLGKLPVGFQHTVGWIGIVTLFMAGATWGYVLFFQETRPASHIKEQESKENGGHGVTDEAAEHGHADAAGKGEHGPAEKADHAPIEKVGPAPSASDAKKPGADDHGAKASKDEGHGGHEGH